MTPKLIQLTNLPRVVLVALPEEAINVFFHDKYIVYETFGVHKLYLPQGNWQLIGKLSELTEEQAKTLVKSKYYPCYSSGDDGMYPEFTHNEIVYADYKGDESDYKDTALDSLHSAIEAQSKTLPGNTLIFKRV